MSSERRRRRGPPPLRATTELPSRPGAGARPGRGTVAATTASTTPSSSARARRRRCSSPSRPATPTGRLDEAARARAHGPPRPRGGVPGPDHRARQPRGRSGCWRAPWTTSPPSRTSRASPTNGWRCRRACRSIPRSSAATRSPPAGRRRCSTRGAMLDGGAQPPRTAAERTASSTGATRSRAASPTRCGPGPLARLGQEPLLGLLRRLRQPADVRHRAGQPVRLDRRPRSSSTATGTPRGASSSGRATYGDRDGDGYLEYLTQSRRAPRTRAGRTAATPSSTTTARRCRRPSRPARSRATGTPRSS